MEGFGQNITRIKFKNTHKTLMSVSTVEVACCPSVASYNLIMNRVRP